MSLTWSAKDHKNLNQPPAAGQKRSRNDAGNKATVVLGAQWGDEGKGKVVDLLATEADLVCRCQVNVWISDYLYFSAIFPLDSQVFWYLVFSGCLVERNRCQGGHTCPSMIWEQNKVGPSQ